MLYGPHSLRPPPRPLRLEGAESQPGMGVMNGHEVRGPYNLERS